MCLIRFDLVNSVAQEPSATGLLYLFFFIIYSISNMFIVLHASAFTLPIMVNKGGNFISDPFSILFGRDVLF